MRASLAASDAGGVFVAGFVARPARWRRDRSVLVMAALPIGGRPTLLLRVSLQQRCATKMVSLQGRGLSGDFIAKSADARLVFFVFCRGIPEPAWGQAQAAVFLGGERLLIRSAACFAGRLYRRAGSARARKCSLCLEVGDYFRAAPVQEPSVIARAEQLDERRGRKFFFELLVLSDGVRRALVGHHAARKVAEARVLRIPMMISVRKRVHQEQVQARVLLRQVPLQMTELAGPHRQVRPRWMILFELGARGQSVASPAFGFFGVFL